jgi:O-antigen/teichoic acid export membrane protein
MYVGAPFLVRFVLGPAFRDSVPVLRVFSLYIPLIALSTVIIFQLLLPNQLDNQFNLVNSTAGVLGILTALLLAPRFEAVGIAWSAVAAQVYVLLAFTVVLRRSGLNPFALTSTLSAGASRVSDLAAVSGLDQAEAPVPFLVSEPELLAQNRLVDIAVKKRL